MANVHSAGPLCKKNSPAGKLGVRFRIVGEGSGTPDRIGDELCAHRGAQLNKEPLISFGGVNTDGQDILLLIRLAFVAGVKLPDGSDGADFFGGRNKFLALAAKKCVNEPD
jgi:hypothetical protein